MPSRIPNPSGATRPCPDLRADDGHRRHPSHGAGIFADQVRPQLGDLGQLELTAYAPIGRFEFRSEPVPGGHKIALTVPPQGEGELLLPPGSQTDLEPLAPDNPLGLSVSGFARGKSICVRSRRQSNHDFVAGILGHVKMSF